ncbi:MAG: sensor histidine kinase, partial [Bacteroidota bacterium]
YKCHWCKCHLDNALRYSPPKSSVDIYLENQAEGIAIKVVDSGPGIPEEQQAHIFERYRRLSNDPKAASTGTGLGLAIVKKILDIHQATIYVRNRPQRGAEFGFELPVVV